MRALALVQLFALLASSAWGTLLEKTRCESEHVPKSSQCTGCPPMYQGKLCASTTRYNDQTKAACGCGKTDPIPKDWWTLTQMTAALNCKNLDEVHPLKSWCPSGCGGCYELCSTGSTTNGGNKTEAGVCRTFKVTNRCGDGYKEYPMWCSNELTWRECRDDPAQCKKKGSTNWYGYPAHFDLQDFHLQISDGLGWDNVEVTFEPVPCSRWKGPSWNCKCNSSDSRHSAWSATDAVPSPAQSPAPARPRAPALGTTRPPFSQVFPSLLPSPIAPPTLPPIAPVPVASGWITASSKELEVAIVHTTLSLGYRQEVETTAAPTVAPYYPHVAVVASNTPAYPLAAAIAAPNYLQTTAAPTAAYSPPIKHGCSGDGEQCWGGNWPGPYCCNTGCTCRPAPGDSSKYVCMPQTSGQTCSATLGRQRSAPVAAAAARPAATLASQASMLQQSAPARAYASPATTARPSQAPAPSSCGKAYDQCGGSQWTGTKCCQPGCKCASPSTSDYKQCRPLGTKPVCEASQEQSGLSSASSAPASASGASASGATRGSHDLLGGTVAGAVAADALPQLSPLPDIGGAGRASVAARLLQAALAVGLTSLVALASLRLWAIRGRRRAESRRLLASYSSVPGEDAAGRGGQRWELPLRGPSPGGSDGSGLAM